MAKIRPIQIYQCDPGKNTTCECPYCAYKPDAIHNQCTTTVRRECAVLDKGGEPIIVGSINGNFRTEAES